MKFQPSNYRESGFEAPALGPCKVTISETDDKLSKKGNDMIELVCVVNSGQKGAGYKLFDYIVDGEYKDSKIGNILLSCGRTMPTVDTDITAEMFKGLSGTVMLKEDEFQGVKRQKIWYWMAPAVVAAEAQKKEDNIPF